MRKERGEESPIEDRGKAVMFLVLCGNEVLMERRLDKTKGFANKIKFPSEKNEEQETHDDAVVRGISEETSLSDTKPLKLGKPFYAITNSAHRYLVQAYFLNIKDKTQVRNTDPNKREQVWMRLDQVHELFEESQDFLVFERLGKRLIGE
jgi:ADP-ribose pyrophosphatase YjhB (NUDIX family)